MEKSIEIIWKEGFLKSDALVAPKVNNLYNQKSKHITAKFTRMSKINLIAIVGFAIAFLIAMLYNGLALIGIAWFILLAALVAVNTKLLKELDNINQQANSYDYLISFNTWLQKQLSLNKKMARIYYPFFFLSIIIGFYFFDAEGLPMGQRLIGEVLYGFPDIAMFNGIPVIALAIVTTIVAILALGGGRIYMWDVNIVYGRVFKKIEELTAEIEELRQEENLV